MVVTEEPRRATAEEIEQWLKRKQMPEPIAPALAAIPITPDMAPILRELIRNQMKIQLYVTQRADFERRRDVGTRTVMVQMVQSIPWKQEIFRWLDEYFEAKMKAFYQIHDDAVVALRSLNMRALRLRAHGAVIVHLGRLGRLWHRWKTR
jgi:hypothetical protein